MEDKKRRAYIIGQTKGFDTKERFETAEKFLRGFGLEVFNPKAHHATVMRECDMVFVLSGYEQSAEALEEYKEAKLLVMPASFQTWK